MEGLTFRGRYYKVRLRYRLRIACVRDILPNLEKINSWVGLDFGPTDLSLSVNRPFPFEMGFFALPKSAGERRPCSRKKNTAHIAKPTKTKAETARHETLPLDKKENPNQVTAHDVALLRVVQKEA